MSVNPETAKARAEYHGKTYYFCCGGCTQKFQHDPVKYAGAPSRVPHAATQQQATSEVTARPGTQAIRYTCPMHPEIVGMGPGSCPICGMALEPMDVVAEEQPDPEYRSMRKRLWVSAALSLPLR